MKQESSKNFVVPLAFVGLMFFTLGFALGINSFLIPVLKGSLNLSSGVAYLLLAAHLFRSSSSVIRLRAPLRL